MGTYCPLIKKNCIEHRCKFFVHLLGKDPQTGNGIDKFDCALAFIPVLLIEGAQQTRQAGAAIESFRNAMVRDAEQTRKLLEGEQKRIQLPTGGNGEANDHPTG